MAWKLDDIEAAVDQLRSRGVAFERSTFPGCGRSTSAW
jgi:hypothetical protein